MSEEFVFEGMTPELQEYLDYLKDPQRDYQKVIGMLEKVKDLVKQYSSAYAVWLCRDETQSEDPKVQISPSGQYRLEITIHTTGKNTWQYSKGKVYRVSDNSLITEVCRNYSSFPYAWVENHINGHNYLLCGKNYQGQTVIELDTGERKDYLPEESNQGFGFCWARIEPSPNGTMLAVDGCYWASSYEVVIYDFTNPMNPPWEELCRDPDNDNFCGWINNDSCKIVKRYEWSLLHNKNVNILTDEEEEELEHYKGKKYEMREETIIWTRK